MRQFIQRHRDQILGVLSGFDRLRLRGTLRLLTSVGGMMSYLSLAGVLIKDFMGYAEEVTKRLRQTTEENAQAAGRQVRYLPGATRKDELIEKIRREEGLAADGLTQVRLQTWFPFNVHVVLNGREWLARRLDAAGIGYRRQDNCFVDLEDFVRAQQLADRQPRIAWPKHLKRLLDRVHPLHQQLFAECPGPYYWTSEQSEWATDIAFRSTEALGELYRTLIHHGIETFQSPDVMRFLGHKVPAHGGVNGHFAGQVVSDLKHRPEGVRIKHRVGRNTLKMYDKQGTVLRVETTINDVRGLKVFRHRALNPLAPGDAQLLATVARGEFHLTGFRNRDVRRVLFGQAASDQQRRRQASRVTRQLALLRAHGLIRKVPTSHRYLLTAAGQVAIPALLATRNATLDQLTPAA